MSTRLKLSAGTSRQLEYLSKRLGLRRNILCRIAIGRSMVDKESVREYEQKDNLGYELNKTTVTGDHDHVFRALITQHEGKRINDFEYFSHYIRNHIERGVSYLSDEFNTVNSPVEFLISLIYYDKREKAYVDLFRKW